MPTNGQFAVGELVTASDANSLFVRGYRNRIINGAFVINQRGYASGTNLASGAYGFDRWKSGYTNTSLTFTAGSQATTVTISTSGVLQQIVERVNIPAGTYILSWTGTATGRIYNSGTASPPAYAASPVSVTLDGTANVVVEFTASGSTKTLGLVQLEAGSAFSPFEYRHRGEETLLCQRYYQRWDGQSAYSRFAVGTAEAATIANALLPYWAPMRTMVPADQTLTYSAIGTTGNRLYLSDGTAITNLTALAIGPVGSSRFLSLTMTTAGGLTTFRTYYLEESSTGDEWLAISVEL